MENFKEVVGIYDTDGNEKLRVPVELEQMFSDVLRPYDVAEKDGHHNGLAPFFSIQDFKSTAGDEIVQAIAAVTRSEENKDRILDIAWSMLGM
jgi:hypothetical protein